MAGSYDGSIRIDTSINSAPIDNSITAIENKIKSIGTTIGLAFGVKELIDFGKRAVTAASDFAEAQNVVDTAFGDMSWKMEQFAATALDTYGISELTAKNMGSTYMAMAKGMGVATDAASDMAVTLTGRLSDIMSFYNKTQSEVDTIRRALITGETEPLKAIGVVMTQTNLSAYAIINLNDELNRREIASHFGDISISLEEKDELVSPIDEDINNLASGFTNCFMDVIKGAETFDGKMLVPDINDLYKFGGDSGQAYFDGLVDYIHETAQSKNLNVDQVLGYTEKTFPGAQTYNFSPYVSPQYYPTNTHDPKLTLSLYLNDEFKDTYTMGGAAGTAAAVSVPLRDINVDNGKGWGW